ncbi:glycosyltransferase [bacterium]|nr:glycosyltransferase [bacterium]
MRILYVCGDQGIPVFGRKGASTHIREMIAAWCRAGHEVMLAAPDLSGDRRPEEAMETVALPAPKAKIMGHDGRYLLANWKAFEVLKAAAIRFGAEAIYERSALYFTAGERVARELGLPRLLEVNALLSEEQELRLHFPRLAHRGELSLVRGAQGIAAISGVMKRKLVEAGCDPERVRPFPMAVDPRRFALTQGVPNRRGELGWTGGEIVLGYVGSMNSYHLPNWFSDFAEKNLRRGESRLRFLVVGGSPSKVERHRERLRQWVDAGLVHFTGSVPQEEMAGWFLSMDAILVPGASPQSTPTKIFEGAALGRTMLLPATEPIRDLCGGDSPILFKAGDFPSFEDTVHRFCQNPAPFNAAAEQLRETVLRDYTWDRHAERLAAWLADLRKEVR